MRFVGVDLAWGTRATTGLAAVDPSGTLLDVAEAVHEDDIVAWLRRWTGGPSLVAFDAPLVVTNLSGRRECEALVGRFFGSFGAHCHPSNRTNPAFADGGRAARVARRAGLDVSPTSAAQRRAVEVYPHPAIVVLFHLPKVLRYKAKPRRDLDLLRAEMLALIGHVEGLAAADVPLRVSEHDGWIDIRYAVECATTKAQLRRVEDRVDAVVCAYIAAYATARPWAVRLLGGADGGSILTPVTPAIGEQVYGAGGQVPPAP